MACIKQLNCVQYEQLNMILVFHKCMILIGGAEESTAAYDQCVCNTTVQCSRQDSNNLIWSQRQSTTGRNYILCASTTNYTRAPRNAGKEC